MIYFRALDLPAARIFSMVLCLGSLPCNILVMVEAGTPARLDRSKAFHFLRTMIACTSSAAFIAAKVWDTLHPRKL